MGDQHRLIDDERAAIGRDAGVPWQRVCSSCGHFPADVGTAVQEEVTDEYGNVVLEDPWLGCPACSEEWQAPDVRYVLAEVPPLDGPELDEFCRAFVAALTGEGASTDDGAEAAADA